MAAALVGGSVLCRAALPARRLGLRPFLGSGTTAIAVLRAGGGRRFLGGDMSAEAVRVARRRVAEEAKAGRHAVPETELATV